MSYWRTFLFQTLPLQLIYEPILSGTKIINLYDVLKKKINHKFLTFEKSSDHTSLHNQSTTPARKSSVTKAL
jgi:hypothetical protein